VVEDELIASVRALASQVDAMILLDQVEAADTGVVTRRVLAEVAALVERFPQLLVIADSRRGLRGFPPVVFKMNANELAVLTGNPPSAELETIRQTAAALARQNRRAVFVTLSERGIIGALPDGNVAHSPAMPVRGPLDIVGAGDAVTANLAAALAAGADLRETLALANAAASIVVHQLGTTGTASVAQLRELAALG
jgi:bifunctional ADP-heptose synthase (sugar kinase/adenylyltransferase)